MHLKQEFNSDKFEQALNDNLWPKAKGEKFSETAQEVATRSSYIDNTILYGE